jgi:DNA helicase-2/ATP-dependent DNA helicase PcrA
MRLILLIFQIFIIKGLKSPCIKHNRHIFRGFYSFTSEDAAVRISNSLYNKNKITFTSDNIFDRSQEEAIVTDTQPFTMLLAGPGTGKTKVLSERLAYLLLSGRCNPQDILVISFTHKAAQNLRNRAAVKLEGSVATVNGVMCDTFHGFCSTILRKHIHVIANYRELVIADEKDQMNIILSILKGKGMPSSYEFASNILRKISFWKEQGYGYLGIPSVSIDSITAEQAYELYPEYQQQLRSMSVLDFGDLLLCTLRLFREHPLILESYRSRYKHILVDEFQDISPAQYDILKMLGVGIVEKSNEEPRTFLPSFESINSNSYNSFINSKLTHNRGAATLRNSYPLQPPKVVNVFCAGDDDQSIYAWRGARLELIRSFRHDFPNSNIIRFNVTYRLPETICKASVSLAKTLPNRLNKQLTSIGSIIEESNVFVADTDNDSQKSSEMNQFQAITFPY